MLPILANTAQFSVKASLAKSGQDCATLRNIRSRVLYKKKSILVKYYQYYHLPLPFGCSLRFTLCFFPVYRACARYWAIFG